MKTITRTGRMERVAAFLRAGNKTVGFVPTMGYLHDGHLALMKEASRRCDVVVVSIFVNPLQFGPTEDLDRYPKDPKRDAAKCREAGVDFLFTPAADDFIGRGPVIFVRVEKLADLLCGASRPAHFNGVATVVLKLLNLVRPSVLYLGEKDFQQTVVVRRMVRDFFLPVRVAVRPTVREKDGLAMSSRNSYLSPEERRAATRLYRTMKLAEGRFKAGETKGELLRRMMTEEIGKEPLARIDYVQIVDPETLEPAMNIGKEARIALAVWIGKTRLIDNLKLKR